MSLLSLALSLVFLALSFLAPNTLTAFLGLGALGVAAFARLEPRVRTLNLALLTLALALPLAFLFRWRFPGRAGFLALSTLPFVLPTPVVALGFLALVGPRGLLGLDLYGTRAVLYWAALFYNLGLALRILLPVALALERPLEAARVLGASPFRAFLRVGLPLLLPALGSAGLLVFLYAFSAFGVPLLLGGPRYATLEVEVYTLLAYRLAFPEASALMLLQVATLAGVALLYLRLQGAVLPPPVPPRPLPRGRGWALALGMGVFFLGVYAPLLALALRLEPLALVSAWASEDFTPLPLALTNTLRFSLGALGLALLLGVAYALAARGRLWVDLLGLLPLMVSPVAVGLGYLVAYPGLRGSLLLLLTAYALLAYPLGGLADRVGLGRMVATGFGLYALVYLGFAWARTAFWALGFLFLYALYSAAFEGANRAYLATLVPEEAKAGAIGLYHTVVGVLLLPASLLFGLLWQAFGAAAAFLTGAALALGALLLFLVDGTGRRAYPG
jgi:thiamine transport system permease protein